MSSWDPVSGGGLAVAMETPRLPWATVAGECHRWHVAARIRLALIILTAPNGQAPGLLCLCARFPEDLIPV
ncbi:hypothetical protein AAFF_G00389420 [Aldrovandia affinis]|uniref:Uncharacterized protein n=1 Tax=Aldrovandia affinis TaxID=143900 RepID=A0AAD7SE88_9TELE|nr:hypothetical protein AAFF_G00389420 [Aldrovandia affinis]